MSVEVDTTALVKVGDEAPDFKGRDENGELVTLSDLRGKKNVLLVFYPYAFSGTCTKEFCELRDENPDLYGLKDTEIIGVSTDPVHSLRAWKAQEQYVNRFVSDFWPHGAISRAYGAFDERIGAPVRFTFLIDKQGVVRFAEHNGIEKLAEKRDQQAWRDAIETLK
ncbi:MAG TPA: redoxin domain-containing protein [Actinomycetota bacterium]|nr:redoxin domain-containing protein [Actinomycetota bacterium]